MTNGKPTGPETAKWWDWLLTIPKPDNPLITGNIAQGQVHPFFCMACTGPHNSKEDHNRRHDMKTEHVKKPIIIPLFVTEKSEAELGTGAQLLQAARHDVEEPIHLELKVNNGDVLTLQDKDHYYVESKEPFYVDLPENNVLDVQGGRTKMLSAGYWAKLEPLDSGKHTITFGGTGGRNNFYTKVTYALNV